jgi:predicted alpha/beta hydrolase
VSRDFYIRQLWDGKGSALVETMDPRAMGVYAELCGHTLAKAHARSGDGIAIASYLGSGDSFDRALASFAETYADQNERDYDALKEAARTGRIAVEAGL